LSKIHVAYWYNGRLPTDSSKRVSKYTDGYGEYYLLGYNAVYYAESQSKFRANTLPPSSGSKNNRSKETSVNGLHGVIPQKIVLFITTALKASNPAN
jgi:hypothetical protein